MSSLASTLEQYPRVPLISTPTPLQYLEHLSRDLNTNVYIKRDDLTELTLGGDKPRKLEYEIAQAQKKGVDTLVTCGSSQSNNARLTTAAARKLGMDSIVVLNHDEWEGFQANLLTVYLMGATVKLIHTNDHWDLEKYALDTCAELEAKGRKPHYIPVSATSPHGCLGYVRCGLEIIEQLEERDVQLDAVYTPFGTGGIFTSLLLAFREKQIDSSFIGISINRRQEEFLKQLEIRWKSICDLLERDVTQARGAYEITDAFLGKEYGDPTEACLDAIAFMGRTEGILLDPVYTGKVFAGLLEHQKQGRWQPDQNILLLHSGGVPALFAYHRVIQQHLVKNGIVPESLV